MNSTPQWPLQCRSETEQISFDIQPLGFDRAFPAHATRSSLPIFRLPPELYFHILGFLTQADLDNLAAVDEDCQRLSALYACKEAEIRYTKSASCALQCDISTPVISHPECVRRLAVVAASPRVTPVLPRSFGEHVAERIRDELKNLHIVDWDCTRTIFPLTFTSALASSPVKHLRVGGTVLHDEGDGPAPETMNIPLETLCLETSEGIPDIKSRSVVFDQLVLPASSTLRQLIWRGNPNLDNLSFNITPSDFPSFARLRSLCLDRVSLNSDNVLQLLLGPHSRIDTLAMDSTTVSTSQFFSTRGYMPYLTHFTWLHHGEFHGSSVADVLSFLDENPQLQALHVPEPLPSWIIDDALIPLIERKLALSSLHLVWLSPDIPEASLQALATIRSLRHLWLSIGRPDAMRSTWEVDHEKMKDLLAPLGSQLETLAFSKDTYVRKMTNAHPLAPASFGFGDYYMNKVLPVDDAGVLALLSPAETAEFHVRSATHARSCPTVPDYDLHLAALVHMRHLAWEKWHAAAILELAGRYYADAFPRLRFLFVGQMPFVGDGNGVLEHHDSPPQREPCMSSLQKKMSMTLWRPV
ncbi:hypothetical protein D9619_012888 [Psilocybe cf. subviscida]|uniref:F-box domain-containing protein n=1 Tax=Psilocybe cf. subviscida TaxID=2480587 RepID=A0A8H5F4N8_9AGAR|nr:hypothetical protein D9619_012888 [Psilocybe cf. subviscida]